MTRVDWLMAGDADGVATGEVARPSGGSLRHLKEGEADEAQEEDESRGQAALSLTTLGMSIRRIARNPGI